MENLSVIKIGGNIIEDETAMENCMKQVSELEGKIILVHGGGKMLGRIAAKLGIQQKMVEGRRITSSGTRDLALMVYAGLINKKIVAAFSGKGKKAIGLSGADGSVIVSSKRKTGSTDYGFVGDITGKSVDAWLIDCILKKNMTPVFCAVTMDEKGELLNTNADTIASAIAVAMSEMYKVNLVYCFEKNGVLADVNEEYSVIGKINAVEFRAMVENKTIVNGMIPKLQNAFSAMENGVNKVIITSEKQVKDAINGKTGTGTTLVA